jgi:hypothetical protein
VTLAIDHDPSETHTAIVGASPTLTADHRPGETHRRCVCGNPLSDDQGFRGTQGSAVVADLPSDHSGTETQWSTVGGSL